MFRTTTGLTAVVLLLLGSPVAAKESKPSLDLSVPLSYLSSLEGTLTLGCGDSGDQDTRRMIQSLQNQGRRGKWESLDDGDRLTAVRRDDKFRMRAWEDGTKKLDLQMPWDVAECLFGGRESEEIRVSVESLRGSGGFRLELAGDSGGIGLSID